MAIAMHRITFLPCLFLQMALGGPDPVLEFTVKDTIPPGTSVHQGDDGTLFYYHYSKPERLYVSIQTIKDRRGYAELQMDVKLPDGNSISEISARLVHGNAIYFLEGGKIYRASFTRPRDFTASFVRDRFEGEVITIGGLCSRVKDDRKVVYRLCDDPERDAVVVDVSPEQLEGYELRDVHRGKAIYLNNRSGREPSAYKMSENVLAIRCIRGTTSLMRDSSRFIYLTNQDCVFAFDIQNALFLPLLSCGATPIRCIVSVINDVLTARGRNERGEECLMETKLPERYFDATTTSH